MAEQRISHSSYSENKLSFEDVTLHCNLGKILGSKNTDVGQKILKSPGQKTRQMK